MPHFARPLVALTLLGAYGVTLGCNDSPNSSALKASPEPTPTIAPTLPPSPSPSPSLTPSPSPTPATIQETSEAHDTFATAQQVPVGATVKGKSETYADFYVLTMPSGQQDGVLKIVMTEDNSSWAPLLTWYGANKTDINHAYATDGTTTPWTLDNATSMAVKPGKTYYVKVDGATRPTDYSLSFNFVPVPDTSEPNDTIEQAKQLTPDQPTDLYLFRGYDNFAQTDVDHFKVDVPVGKTKLLVAIKNNSPEQEAQRFTVGLLKADQTEVDSASTLAARADFNRSFDVPAAGTYFLKISGAPNSTTASKLTVSLQ